MRNIIIIGMLLTAASTAGWFTIQRNGDHVSIDIDRAEIRADTSKMIERSREALSRQEQLAAQMRAEQQRSGQSQPASPWGQQPAAPWATGQTTANYPSERGFAGPPPAYNPGYAPAPPYAPTQNSGGQGYAPTQYYTPPPYEGPNQNYAPYQYTPNSNAPYNAPAPAYPRQASPYNPQPTYPR